MNNAPMTCLTLIRLHKSLMVGRETSIHTNKQTNEIIVRFNLTELSFNFQVCKLSADRNKGSISRNGAQGINSKKLYRLCCFSKMLVFIKQPSFLKFTPCAELVKFDQNQLYVEASKRTTVKSELLVIISPRKVRITKSE